MISANIHKVQNPVTYSLETHMVHGILNQCYCIFISNQSTVYSIGVIKDIKIIPAVFDYEIVFLYFRLSGSIGITI